MKKKKLMELPVPDLPEKLVGSMPESTRIKSEYGYYHRKNIFFNAVLDNSTGEDVLVLDLWKPNGTHLFRHFVSKNGNYFTSYGRKQSKASFRFLYEWNRLQYCLYHQISRDSVTCIDTFLKNDQKQYSGIERLYHYSDALMKAKLKAKHEKIRKSINDEMLVVRPLPKRVEKWINDVLMADSQYIFYENNRRKETTGYCTCCTKTLTLLRPKHHSYGKCPECRKTVQFISKSMFKRRYCIVDKHTCAWIQKTPNGCVIRQYSVRRQHTSASHFVQGTITEQDITEESRVFYTYDREAKRYEFRISYQNDYVNWRYCYNPLPTGLLCPIRLCPIGLNNILRYDGLKAWYTDFEKMAKLVGTLDIDHLMDRKYHDNPLLMQLVNAKLSNLLSDFWTGRAGRKAIDMTVNNLTKALGIEKSEIARLVIPLNPDFTQLEVIRTALQRKDQSDISDYRYIFDYIGDSGYESNLKMLLKYMTIHRIVAYIKKQKASTKNFDGYEKVAESWKRQNFFRDYLDYLSNAEILGWNTSSDSVRFPKNFISAHDHTAAEVKALQNKQKQELFSKIQKYEVEYNENYYYEDRKLGFLIRAPHDQKEIVYEGQVLHHCVATYRERVAKKETIILFIRKIDDLDTPFFTLNLDPRDGTIIQCRGLQNCSYPADVKKFMDKWYEEKIRKITGRIGA